MGKINTRSGGLVETGWTSNRMNGENLYLHIDQSSTLNNSEGDAAILLVSSEVKELIAHLNDFINFVEGKPYVVLAEPLLHPDVVVTYKGKPVEKNAGSINRYTLVNDITPGDSKIDADNYFESVALTINIPDKDDKDK